MGSISHRVFIRWLPDDASEPTSTIVLTSPERRFVDLRILLPSGNRREEENLADPLSLDRLDWAIAGSSSSTLLSIAPDGSHITHSVWQHWIDSRTMDPEGATDEGDMYPLPDGTTLEKGRMRNPATGEETDYEELWRDKVPVPGEERGSVRCVVVELEDDARGRRGRVLLLGRHCQGMLRDGQSVTVERWKWKTGSGWERRARIGDGSIPGPVELISKAFGIGALVSTGVASWKVVEVSETEAHP